MGNSRADNGPAASSSAGRSSQKNSRQSDLRDTIRLPDQKSCAPAPAWDPLDRAVLQASNISACSVVWRAWFVWIRRTCRHFVAAIISGGNDDACTQSRNSGSSSCSAREYGSLRRGCERTAMSAQLSETASCAGGTGIPHGQMSGSGGWHKIAIASSVACTRALGFCVGRRRKYTELDLRHLCGFTREARV
jgi:hypothetical protein